MWDGPYGDGGSAKYLFASLHQSLRRLGLDYVDIFYHHRPDPAPRLEETCQALALMVRQGRRSTSASPTTRPRSRPGCRPAGELGTPAWSTSPNTPCSSAMLSPTPAGLPEHGSGVVAFSPLAGAAERSLPGGHSRGFPRRQCQPSSRRARSRGEARHRPAPCMHWPNAGAVPS